MEEHYRLKRRRVRSFQLLQAESVSAARRQFLQEILDSLPETYLIRRQGELYVVGIQVKDD